MQCFHFVIIFITFFWHHTSPLVMFIIFSPLSLSILTFSLFRLELLFSTHHCIEDGHILPHFTSWACCLEILVWKVGLLVRIHVTSHYEESLLRWVIYYHWRLFSICKSTCKKKKKVHYLLYHSPLNTCMYVEIYFFGFMCQWEFVCRYLIEATTQFDDLMVKIWVI